MTENGAEMPVGELWVERTGRWWRWAIAAVAVLALATILVLPRWKAVIDAGGQRAAEPFRIAGNLYYVGASDVTAFLLTGPEVHILIDGGYPGTAPMIMASVARIGFRMTDVRVLLNTHAHPDHAGGLAALKRASKAQLWASEQDARALESGGDDPMIGVARPLVWSGLFGFPPVQVDRRFRDGQRISVGPTSVTATKPAAAQPGLSTSWKRDGATRWWRFGVSACRPT